MKASETSKSKEYIEILDEADYEISDLEVKQICRQVEKKYYKKPISKTKRYKKMFLVAALMVCLTAAIPVFSRVKGNLIELLFVGNKDNLSESGKLMEQSDERQNIKVTIKGIIGYDKVLSLIYDVEKTDGEAFKGNQLAFYSYIEVEDGEKKARYVIQDNREILSERADTKRQYVATISNYFDNIEYVEGEDREIKELEQGNVESFRNKKMKLVIEEVAQRYMSYDESELNLAQYMKEHADTNHSREEDELELYDNKLYDNKLYNGFGEEVELKQALGNAHLGLVPYGRRPKVTIDNIGFVEGKLHMRISNITNPIEENTFPQVQSSVVRWDKGCLMSGNMHVKFIRREDKNGYKCMSADGYNLRLLDEKGEMAQLLYSDYNGVKDNSRERYLVYDINNVEELSKYKMKAVLKYSEVTSQDKWEIPFEADFKETVKNVSCAGEIKGELGDEWVVDKINLANVYTSIQLHCTNKTQDPMLPTPIKIIMKDQTETTFINPSRALGSVKFDSTGAQDSGIKDCYVYESRDEEKVSIDGFFLKAIDINQIKSIKIGDKEIPVN